MPSAWKPLHLDHTHNGLPPLLVKYECGPSDYKVWLTDLSYLWTEALDRRQIIRKALNLDTSIDPSEDSRQLGLFLRSIEEALQQCPGTSVNLDESNDIKQLTLHTSTPLPHPLQSLEWSIVLVLAPQSTFASDFVSTILNQQLNAKVEKNSLLQQLKEKDNVISKLIDKLQGDGVDLGKVFPGAVSSKSGIGPNARQAVAKSIKGLREFDQDQWESQLAKDNEFSRNLDDTLFELFDGDGKDTGAGLQISDYGEWWKRAGRKDSQIRGTAPAILKTGADQESVVEDSFQRQSTPSKSSARTPSRQGLFVHTEPKDSSDIKSNDPQECGSTTDEGDDDIQSSPSTSLPLRTDDVMASGSANSSQGIRSEPMDLDENGVTTSASDMDNTPAKNHVVAKSKQMLGKIGGKGKDSSAETSAVPTLKPKLGKIGGKGKLGKIGGTKSVSSHDDDAASNKTKSPVGPNRGESVQNAVQKTPESERRGRTVQWPQEPSPPRETSHERANRKREQLKRELEKKSQAGAKKKRKF